MPKNNRTVNIVGAGLVGSVLAAYLAKRGAKIVLWERRPDLRKVMARLGAMEITSVLIEGGALVNWTALAAGVVDKVFLYYAPKILAGVGSVPFASGEGFQRITDAATVSRVTIHHFDEDFAVEGYLRDPYLQKTRELTAL